jgi:tRNA-intron endonuclease
MLSLKYDPKKGVWSEDAESIDKLKKNFFGSESDGKLWLEPEEALYLITFQNAVCECDGKGIGFNGLASIFSRTEPRLFIRYNAYRDWRDRGLILHRFIPVQSQAARKAYKEYPSKPPEFDKLSAKAVWYPDDFFSVIEDEEVGKQLFNTYWFGQFGIYKQERGNLLKLDFMETVFISKHMGLAVIDAHTEKEIKPNDILKAVVKAREYAKQLCEVYEDWRLKGFVVKTGLKFGSHFRIYFPGASPSKGGEWIHSKHVLHVFPKEQRLLISEWARAVRVAHGVKKTFLLAIPEMKQEDYTDRPTDFIAYRRKKAKGGLVRETPEDKPRYLMAAVSEDEHIGGVELASLLKKASDMGLELLLSITDRETAITYYVLKRVTLPGSDYEYYEIEWMKP